MIPYPILYCKPDTHVLTEGIHSLPHLNFFIWSAYSKSGFRKADIRFASLIDLNNFMHVLQNIPDTKAGT